jgi:hypothetical protein
VRIRRIEHDFGPATKLIPSVIEAQQMKENVLIMVVDDDTLYSVCYIYVTYYDDDDDDDRFNHDA